MLDAAVERSYGGSRAIHWLELYAGEKANERFGDAFRELYKVIKDYAVKKEDIETAEGLLKQVPRAA